MIREDPLVDLATAAVRLRVIDDGVVVDEPLPVAEIQPVQRAVDPFAVEDRNHVVAHQRPAEAHRMRLEPRVPASYQVHRPDVVRVQALVLKLVVIHRRILADDDLGDGVGEIAVAPRADVALDD